jgi:peptidyl-prolyl cis-trans isomerase SurA
MNATIDTTALANLTAGFARDSTLFALALEDWSDVQKETGLAQMGGRRFTLQDFLDYGAEKRQNPPSSYDFDETLTTLDRMLTERSLEVAASKLEERDPAFRDLMNEYRDGIVLFRIMEDSVWNKANTDTVGLESLFQANADKYQWPERIRVISFYSTSDSVLSEIAASWTPGDTTDWMSTVDEEGFRVDTTFISDSTNSIYDQALALAPGETSAPLRYRRGYMLLAHDGVEAPRGKTFSEARADVVTEYQSQLEAEWLGRLRSKYGVELYPDHLRAAFEETGTDGMSSTE